MKNYCLRGIPCGLWLRARHLCIEHGISFRELILRALRDYCQRHIGGDHNGYQDINHQ